MLTKLSTDVKWLGLCKPAQLIFDCYVGDIIILRLGPSFKSNIWCDEILHFKSFNWISLVTTNRFIENVWKFLIVIAKIIIIVNNNSK